MTGDEPTGLTPLTRASTSASAVDQAFPPVSIPDHALLRCIGCGSYGTVWLARNSLGIYRAVKVVYRASFSDSRPFEREWAGICKFEPISRSHEGFVDVLHVGIDPERRYFYYVMELGDDAQAVQAIEPERYQPRTLDREVATRGTLIYDECLRLGLALSQALDELHRHGLVHRDIKPSSIIFVNGIPKLADIGLVAEAAQARSLVGTEGFIPPEGPGTVQADVYALGMVLYEAVSGMNCGEFPRAPAELHGDPERDKLSELYAVIRKAANPSAGARYASSWEMHADLLVLANGKSVKRLRVLERRAASIKRYGVVCLGAGIVLAAGFLGFYKQREKAFQLRQRQAGADVAYGIQAMNAGDFSGALPWFAEALQLELEDPRRAAAHRLRFGLALEQSPKLSRLWVEDKRSIVGGFSPDGERVLIAQQDGEVRLYDTRSGALCARPLRVAGLRDAAFSPDGGAFVTVSQSGAATIWNSTNCLERRRLPSQSQLGSARFSPDGQRLVTAGNDGVARVWDVHTGGLALTLKGHSDVVDFATFSHDGKLIATASHDNTVRVWDAQSGQRVGLPLQHDAAVTCLAFSVDDRKLVTTCLDHKARVWETATGKRIPPDLNHPDRVQSVSFSPDGRFILTGGMDGVARLWLVEGMQSPAANAVLRHSDGVTRAEFSADGRRILSTCADGTVRIWDLAGTTSPGVAARGALSADGSRFLAVVTNGLEIRDPASGALVSGRLPLDPEIEKARPSRDGRFVVTASAFRPEQGLTNCLLRVWDARTSQMAGPGISIPESPVGVALSGDGQKLAVIGAHSAQVWDVLRGTPLSPPVIQEEQLNSVEFSSNAKRFATSSGNAVRLWNAESGRAATAPLVHTALVRQFLFSPDGKYLASCCAESNLLGAGYAQVWEATTGRGLTAHLGHSAGVLALAFSPDSRWLATGSADSTARIWDVSTGQLAGPPLKHEKGVQAAAFSPDGRWLATASGNVIRLWDPQSGEPVSPPLQDLSKPEQVVFLPGELRIAASETDGGVRVWELFSEQKPVEDLLSMAWLLSGGTLTGGGELSVVKPESPGSLWQRLQTKYPADFETSSAEIAAWHEFAGQESEGRQDWRATVFHLRRLLLLRPDDAVLAIRLADAQDHLGKGG